MTSSKPLLAAICNQENQEAECSESRSQLWQTSHQNSMAADGQESSFAPFHDSWAGPSSNVVSKPLICQPVVHVPLEAPIMGGHTMNSSCIEASFTQVGICHPKQFDPTSTPMGTAKGTDFTFDISVITDHHQPIAKVLGPLSPITEEPSSFKSSSSSRSSNSTASSVPSEPPSTHTHVLTEFNPFLPQYVKTMLNTLTHTAGDKLLVRLNSPIPKLGTTVCLDGCSLSLKKINEGGFATIFLAKEEDDVASLHTFKVQSPPCEWEVVVMAEVRERLKRASSKFLVSRERGEVRERGGVLVNREWGGILVSRERGGVLVSKKWGGVPGKQGMGWSPGKQGMGWSPGKQERGKGVESW